MKIRCPNGHKLSADDSQAGRRAICPKCSVKFVVPALRPKISETSILSVLGDFDGDRSVVTRAVGTAKSGSRLSAPEKLKSCPRCRQTMTLRFQICPNCRLYLPDTNGLKA